MLIRVLFSAELGFTMSSQTARANCLHSVITASEAAFMYKVTSRRVCVWCEDGIIEGRKTEGGGWLVSLDHLIVVKGSPKRWPGSLSGSDGL